MSQFITEVEIADEDDNVVVLEVVTEMPSLAAVEAAEAAYSAGNKSHNEAVRLALDELA